MSLRLPSDNLGISAARAVNRLTDESRVHYFWPFEIIRRAIVHWNCPMLYADVPTRAEFSALDAKRGEICVSIYLPTTPVTRATKGDRILFKNLVGEAVGQLSAAKASKRRVSALQSRLTDLQEDDRFWAYLADGLAVFATPDDLRTFRLPVRPAAEAQISDRFHVKPLVPLLAAAGNGFVLALSQGGVRLIEFTPGLAEVVKVPGLPKTMSSALKRQLPRDRAPTRRIQGSEGMKVLIGQYCRIVDRALRPVLAAQGASLILATVNEMAAIYRANSSYPHLAKSVIKGNPEHLAPRELATAARAIVKRKDKRLVNDRLVQLKEGLGKGRSSADLATIAKAAIHGRIETLLIDVKASVPGTINPSSGKLKLAAKASAGTYDVLDELVGLTIRTGGDVLPIASKALSNDSPAGAILR
ncbi:MAG: hypothetical protein ACR2Q4_08580 [Geminicoccaceae bacterium]